MIYINLLAKLFKLNNLNHNGENSFTTFLTTRGRTQIKFRTLFTVGQDTIVSPKFAHSSIELLDKRTWETSYFPSRTRQDLFAKQPTGRNFSIQKKKLEESIFIEFTPHPHTLSTKKRSDGALISAICSSLDTGHPPPHQKTCELLEKLCPQGGELGGAVSLFDLRPQIFVKNSNCLGQSWLQRPGAFCNLNLTAGWTERGFGEGCVTMWASPVEK